jgi:hypothetical protein
VQLESMRSGICQEPLAIPSTHARVPELAARGEQPLMERLPPPHSGALIFAADEFLITGRSLSRVRPDVLPMQTASQSRMMDRLAENAIPIIVFRKNHNRTTTSHRDLRPAHKSIQLSVFGEERRSFWGALASGATPADALRVLAWEALSE